MTLPNGAGPATAGTVSETRKIGTGERRESSSHTSLESQAHVHDVADAHRLDNPTYENDPEVATIHHG